MSSHILRNMVRLFKPYAKKYGRKFFGKSVKGKGRYSYGGKKRMPRRYPQPAIFPSMVDSTAMVPSMHSSKNGLRVRHREYIGDLSVTNIPSGATGPSAFTISSLYINPGLVASFPWLSTIAQSFEQYKVHGLLFEFKSLSAEIATGSTATNYLGSVFAVADYNVVSGIAYSKSAVENQMWSMSCKPSESMIMPLEAKQNQTQGNGIFYIRNQPPGSNQDLRLFDIARIDYGTQGMPLNGTAGELWMSYDIELLKPILPNPVTTPANISKYINGRQMATSTGVLNDNFPWADPTESSTSSAWVTNPYNISLSASATTKTFSIIVPANQTWSEALVLLQSYPSPTQGWYTTSFTFTTGACVNATTSNSEVNDNSPYVYTPVPGSFSLVLSFQFQIVDKTQPAVFVVSYTGTTGVCTSNMIGNTELQIVPINDLQPN